MLYGVWISVQEDCIRLKSCPSANDETTYLILVLVEDERRCLSVELDGTTSSVNTLMRGSWDDDRRRYERVEDGRTSGRCAVKQWGLLADFAIP